VKRRDARIALVAAVCMVMALLTVFAIELSDTQAKSKHDVVVRVHERAVLAAALIDSLFQTVQQQIPQDTKQFGGRTVSDAAINKDARGTLFVALLDPAGQVLAASRGFTPQARASLATASSLALLHDGDLYGLGDAQPYGRTRAIDFAVRFKTLYGWRTLVTGFSPSTVKTLIGGELRKIPGVMGAHHYLIDGRGTVLASTNPAIPAGYRLTRPSQLLALAQASGDVKGHYYDQVHLSNSTWRVLLSAPDGPLFASISGLRKWLPWAIFVAFALVALAVLVLARRLLRRTEQVRTANLQLELVNGALADTNATLERRAAELARSNAELEQFASIASHDLQEPLRKVRTFTQQLTVMESENLSDKGRDYLLRANTAAERMQKLIEDLLKYSRVATHGRPFVAVDLEEVTHQVLDDLDEQVRRSGAVVHVGQLPTISADPLQMRQLFQNLISNALKFRRPGVVPEVWIEHATTDGQVQLSVRDNGIGFEPQYERRIFRVFERLHGRNDYPGTGIGLALCRKIVERHGGRIVAEGVPDAGATFTVTLPPDQAEAVIAPSRARDAAAGRERVQAHVSA
jgi:signal transduction histidine kinase